MIIIVSKVDDTNGKLQDGLFRENEYVNTLELIKTTMLDTLGGVLVIERIGGIKFLNYLENYGSTNSQPIKFGVNLLDYSKITDASGIYTAIVPYGKEIDGKKLTIATVNNDCDYIYDELAVAEYGWIFKEFEWPDIDSASALMYAAKLKLTGGIKQGMSLELTAFDLSEVNVDIQKFQVGDMARSVSKPHDLDAFLSVSKKERDLLNPGNDRIVLGGVTQSLTDRISGPLGGGIMGFALTTANTVKNMEYVSNELSFLIKITAETVEEQGTTINETKLEMDAFQISLSALETRTTDAQSAIDAAELLITPQAITATVRSSTEYTADLANKATVGELGALTSRVTTAEQKITADAIVSTVTSSSTYTTALAGKASTADLSSLTTRVSTAETKITPTAITSTVRSSTEYTNDLGAKVSTSTYTGNEIVSRINQTATTIDIDASKVNITGFVTFANLSTSGQTTINGGNISGGSLNFANFTCTGSMRLTEASGATISFSSGSKTGGIGSNSTRGMTINSGDTMLLYTTSGGLITLQGPVTVTGTLTAPNIPTNIPATTSSSSTKVTELAVFYDSGASKYYLNVTCNGSNRGAYFDISDQRLKTNIKDSNVKALDKIEKARLRSFNWVESGGYNDCGVVAQEVEKDLGEKYVLKVPQPNGGINYQIASAEFTPLILKAIQELNAKLTKTSAQQANEIAYLKYQIKELKGEL